MTKNSQKKQIKKRHSNDGDAMKKRSRSASSKEKKKQSLSPAALRGREKRLEKRRRRIKKFFKGLLIGLVILALLTLIFIFGFRLKNVNVTGNSRYTKEEILDIIHYDDQYHNTFIFYLKNRHLNVENVPFVDSIYMAIGSNDTINVEVVEKTVAGCINDDGRYIYIDTDGIVCEISDTRQDDVPLLEGLEFEEPSLNKMLKVTDESIYNSLLNLTLLLKKYEISIDKILFKQDGTLSIQMGDIQVMLGNSDNMEDKITELANLLPQLENLKGILHLENYDSTKDSIIFTKES